MERNQRKLGKAPVLCPRSWGWLLVLNCDRKDLHAARVGDIALFADSNSCGLGVIIKKISKSKEISRSYVTFV